MTAPKGYWPTWITTFVFFGAFYAVLVPLPLYLAAAGLPDWQIGIILGAFGVGSLLSRPFAGLAADNWGVRPVLLFGAVAATIGALGLSLTTHPLLLLCLRAIQTVGYVAFTTSATTLVAALAPAERRAASLALFGVAANVAMTIMPAMMNLLLTFMSLRQGFWISGALAAACGLLAWLILPQIARPSAPHAAGQPWFQVSGTVLNLMGMAAILGVGFGAFLQFAPLLAARRPVGPVGLAYTLYGLGIIGTRLVTGRRLDHQAQRFRIFVAAFVFMAAGAGGLACAATPWLFLGSSVLIAIASGILHPGLMALHVEQFSASERGRATSLFYLGFDFGIGLGAWCASPVLQWIGLTGFYALAAGLQGVGLGLLVALRRIHR